MPRETLLDFFNDFAGLDDEFLLHYDGFLARRYSYREIAAHAQTFAARLSDAGIGHDDKVILYGENRPEWIIALWGCLLEGVIAVPIDYRASKESVDRVHAIVGARAVFTGEEPGMYDGHAPAQAVTITKDQTAEIIFTSGATAEPK